MHVCCYQSVSAHVDLPEFRAKVQEVLHRLDLPIRCAHLHEHVCAVDGRHRTRAI